MRERICDTASSGPHKNGCFCGAATVLTFWLGASLWEVQHIKI